jgi:hypothetical protein
VDDATKEWATAIRGINGGTIRRVFDYLVRESGSEFPPTLPAFMGLCRQFRIDDPQPERIALEDLQAPVSTHPSGNHPLELLQEARGIQAEEDPDLRTQRLRAHEQLIIDHRRRGLLRGLLADGDHLCSARPCQNAGVLSHSIQGGTSWYCAEHFQRG